MVETPAHVPSELLDFIDRLKKIGARGYRGDFVASDGTRVPLELMFERAKRTEEEE